jgi:hypothetical protein
VTATEPGRLRGPRLGLRGPPSGARPGGALRAGEPQTVEIVFDAADPNPRCRVPLEFSHLAFNVEGTVEVASRQEWGLSYGLLPSAGTRQAGPISCAMHASASGSSCG